LLDANPTGLGFIHLLIHFMEFTMSYINTLWAFRSKYKFAPKAGLIQEYLRIAERAHAEGNQMLWLHATTHAMRLGYNISTGK
jgi:hypothetical protein